MGNTRLLRDYLVSTTDGYKVEINKITITTKTPTDIIGSYSWYDYHGRYQEDVSFTVTLMDLFIFSYEVVKGALDDMQPDSKY